VNGDVVQVPYTSVNRVYSVRYSGSYLRFETTFGLRVEYANYRVNVYVPAAYSMQGFCGNNDGIASNDLTLANGTYVGGLPGAPNLVGDSYIVYDPEDPYRE
jgi:von Willebrand factor type D domain